MTHPLFKNPAAETQRELAAWLEWMEVSSPRRQQAINVYTEWAAAPRHIFSQTDNPAAAEVNACVVSRIDCGSQFPTVRVAALDRGKAQFIFRRIKLKQPRLQAMTPLQLGKVALYAKLPDGDGFYELEQTPRWFREEVVGLPAQNNARQALDKMAAAAGSGGIPGYLQGSMKQIHGPLLAALVREEGRRIRKTYHTLFRHLDQNALGVMRKARTLERWTYQWLTGEREADSSLWERKKPTAAGPLAQRNRQQAMQAFPALVFMMRDSRTLTQKIDDNQPVIPAILAELNEGRYGNKALPATAECVKQLYGVSPRGVDPKYKWHQPLMQNNLHAAEFHNDLGLISSLPREWRPRQPAQWQRFRNVGLDINDWFTLTGRSPKELIQDFAALAKTLGNESQLSITGRLGAENHAVTLAQMRSSLRVNNKAQKFRHEMGAVMPAGKVTPEFISALGRREYGGRFHELNDHQKDFINRLGEQVVLPAIIQTCAAAQVDWAEALGEHSECAPPKGHLSGQTARLLFNKVSVPMIHRASRRWHAQAGQMERLVSRYDKPSSWPALFDETAAPNGVTIRCLTTSEQLQKEGDEQKHCVAGYSFRCMFEGSHIVALRALDGQWRTTMELMAGSRGFRVHQHVLARNESGLPEPARAAEKWLMTAIGKNEISVHRAAVEATREANRTLLAEHKREQFLLRIGFDPLSEADANNAYQRWRRAIPDILPEPTRVEMLARTGIPAFVQNYIASPKP